MGLDMSLMKKHYVSDYLDGKSGARQSLKISGHPVADTVDPSKVVYIVEDVIYWRKANAIHQWFVDNVQNGNDDCGTYWVSIEKLEELRDLCKRVMDASELVDGEIVNGYTFKDGEKVPNMETGKYIKDPTVAKELLPTTEGFFFGSTDYDQWYYEDIANTYKELSKTIANAGSADFEYSSSW